VARSAPTHVDSARNVGRRLREARQRAGLSQRELAFPGCTAAYISRLEAGERVPSLQLINELARRLQVTGEFLATGIEPEIGDSLLDAEVALRLGELETAEELFRAHLGATDPARPQALAGLGQLAFRADRLSEAIDYLEEALREQSPLVAAAPAVDLLVRAHAMTGALEAAEALSRRALSDARAAGASLEILRFAVLLANALIDNGRFADAGEELADAIRIAEEVHDPLAAARVFWTQSRLHVFRRDAVLAARYARKALEILERTENDSYSAMAYHLLAYAEVESGNAREALTLLQRGRELFGDRFTDRDEAKFSLEEARASLSEADTRAAARAATRALETIAALEPGDRGRAYVVLGDVFRANGDGVRALELYEQAVELLEEHGKPHLLDAAERLAGQLEDEGRAAEALAVLKRAMQSRPAVATRIS
jgi:tetratricopeptide (TPR) repeat protein